MKLILTVIVGLCLVGCANFEDLSPGNLMAKENQGNLEKNTMRLLDNFHKLGKAQPNWNDQDEKIFQEQRNVIAEQLAINHLWLLVIQDASESEKLDAKFFGTLIGKVPDWIKSGKDLADLIKSHKKED
jgi:hypothetical protein